MILVVGGAGYLGSHISSLLRSRCTVYDNLTYRDEFLADVPFIYGDVTDHDHLKHWLDQAHTVVWLAAIVGDAACSINPVRATEINVDAVKFLADNFSGPIIFTSTASVYGASEGQCDEKSPLNPQSLYAETKMEAESILSNSNALILRLGTLHGLSDRMRFDLVVNVMTRDAVEKEVVTVFGGEQKRPLLHVMDAAHYIYLWIQRILEDNDKGDWGQGVYNFATQNLTIRDVAKHVVYNVPGSEIYHISSEHEDKRDYSMSCSKLEQAQTWSVPLLSIVRSVRDIGKVLREGRIKDLYSDRYVNARVIAGGERNGRG